MAETLTIRVRRHVVDIDLDVPLDPVAPITVLFGPSGAGKTTLLRCVAGLDRPEPGSRIAFGAEVWDDGRQHMRSRARQIGYLFQDHALFPHMTVLANVTYGLHRLPRRQRGQRALDALTAANAGHLRDRQIRLLSGGEGQRVALARALAPQPRLLLLDEPLSALDTPTRLRLRGELRQLLVQAAIPTLVVTHDRAEAITLGDRAAVIVDGRLRQFGAVEDVFSRPADPEVASAVGVETVAAGTVVENRDGISRVQVGSAQVQGVAEDGLRPGATVLVCLRAENVALELPGGEHRASPRNELPATITGLYSEGPLTRIGLDAGFPLAAYVTRPTCDDLGLRPGLPVVAVVKASAVHLIPRATTPEHSPGRPVSAQGHRTL